MPNAEILIVGAGASGLSVAGALRKEGLHAVVLDKDDCIGGSWARRYERLHLHTMRAYSGLAHLPISRRLPRYVSKSDYAQYLQEYARHFDLQCVLNCTVQQVRRSNDGSPYEFAVETNDETWRSRIVVVATGQHGIPVIPDWRNMEQYEGRILHSFCYKSGIAHTGKRVLIVGAGNSGAEIAVDLVEQGAAFVAISIRTPPAIVPRDFLGTPVQLFGVLMSRLPSGIADAISSAIARIALGDLTRYGLGRAEWLPFSAKRIPTIDVGFVKQLKGGAVQVRPNIAHFTRTGVMFDDRREEAFDDVIVSTGFATGLDRLLAIPNVLDEMGYPKELDASAAEPGLYFAGYTHSHRGHLYEANRASRRLAKIIKRSLLAKSIKHRP
ncbi:MAG: NAD(P)/FAD-dependent oxidoreductase [Gemmatimonadaceae bacterium]